jgi:hypothetical protein
LDNRASEDELFAATYAKPHKNIDDCITYILNEVRQSEYNGFADDEIYSMAVHYYDEDSITAGSPIDCHVVVNHHIELTAEEKEEARKEALQKATSEAYAKITTQPKKSGKTPAVSNIPNLFNC